WANRYTYNWNVFAPVQYESNESGGIKGGQLIDEWGPYSPTLSSEFYQLSLKILVEPLFSDIIQWHSLGDETDRFVEKLHPDFDRLMINEDKKLKQIVASKDKVVMYVGYSGNAEIDVIIENAAQKISLLAGE
ncbi:MAG: hypothetical protein RR603_06915, partial [Kurthia sp.]